MLLSLKLNGVKAERCERIYIQSVEDDFGYKASETLLLLGNFLCNSKDILFGILTLHLMATNLVACQGTRESTLRGEISVLRRALSYSYKPRQIFLTIEPEGADYIGCFLMESRILG